MEPIVVHIRQKMYFYETMKTRCFFLLFLFATKFSLGQSINRTALQKSWENPALSIEKRVHAGALLVETWLREDNETGLKLAMEVKVLSLKSHKYTTQAIGLLSYGKALEFIQEFRKAKKVYDQAHTTALKIKADSLEIEALCGLAHTHVMLQELNQATKNYIQAVKLVENSRDLSHQADVYVLCAEYYRGLARYDTALDYLAKVRSILRKGSIKKETEIEMYSRYAAVWNESHVKLDSAIMFSEKCIQLGTSINDMHVVATAHNELAVLKKKANKPNAIQHSYKAIEIWRKINYLAYEGGALMTVVWYFGLNTHPQRITTT